MRLTAEVGKPNGDRLREYRDSNLESLKFELFSPAPIYPELERAKLIAGLTFLAEQLGGEHPLVKKVLAGKSPARPRGRVARRHEAVRPGRAQAAGRGRGRGGRGEHRPDDRLRPVRSTRTPASCASAYETEVEEPERQAYGEIAKVRFAVLGKSVPPDATFTLRLAFGVVKGYDAEGQKVPFATTFGGLYERAEKQRHKEPFELPKRWVDGKDKLDLSTPFDFVSTADTIGGNSGSPVLNRAGEFVGINFDRNRFGLVRNFVYTDEQARHISVHSRAILEALRKLYDAAGLVEELTGKE